MAAVEHALPNDNSLRVGDVEVTFIVQVHPVGPHTQWKVSSIGLERCVPKEIERTGVAIDINRRNGCATVEDSDFATGLQLGSTATFGGCQIRPAGWFQNSRCLAVAFLLGGSFHDDVTTRVGIDEDIVLGALAEAVDNGVIRRLRGDLGHVNMIPRPEPISGQPRPEVAIFRVQAPPRGDGVLDVDGTRVGARARDVANEGCHVEVLRTAILWYPKPRADAVAVGTFRKIWHVDRLPLPLGTVVDDGKNYKVLRKYIRRVALVGYRQRAATRIVSSVGVDIVMSHESVTGIIELLAPFLPRENVIRIRGFVSSSGTMRRWHFIESAAHDDVCHIVRRQGEGPPCLGLAIDLPMHPPLRIRLTSHDGFREPVHSIFRRKVACDLTGNVDEGEVCARLTERRRKDDCNDCLHGVSKAATFGVNRKEEELWLSSAGAMMISSTMVCPRLVKLREGQAML